MPIGIPPCMSWPPPANGTGICCICGGIWELNAAIWACGKRGDDCTEPLGPKCCIRGSKLAGPWGAEFEA